jgi:ribosomal protein S18 acetylase RimI-like enzyme
MNLVIRKATDADSSALSRICLLTADAGESAEGLHDYGELPGLIWAVPYVKLPTTWGFVLVDEALKDEAGQGLVVGYIVGTTDTRAFEQYAAQHWWPAQAEKYSPSLASKPVDLRCINMLHNMQVAPDANLDFADAHMHINILKEYQGKGWGRQLVGRAVEYLKEVGVKGDGLWLGLDPRNANARKFYEKLGFGRIRDADENHMGLKFANWP